MSSAFHTRRAGSAPDEEKIVAALPRAEACLSALEELLGEASWLAGSAIRLADLHTAPMFARFRMAPEGEQLFDRHRRLAEWWERIRARPSFLRTQAAPRTVRQEENWRR
jgi:glutathione S-transferase